MIFNNTDFKLGIFVCFIMNAMKNSRRFFNMKLKKRIAAIISFTMLGMKRLPITMLPIAREQIVPAVVNSTL